MYVLSYICVCVCMYVCVYKTLQCLPIEAKDFQRITENVALQ